MHVTGEQRDDDALTLATTKVSRYQHSLQGRPGGVVAAGWWLRINGQRDQSKRRAERSWKGERSYRWENSIRPLRISPHFFMSLKKLLKNWKKISSIDQYMICHFTNIQIQIQLIHVEIKITNLTMNITHNSRSNLFFFNCISRILTRMFAKIYIIYWSILTNIFEFFDNFLNDMYKTSGCPLEGTKIHFPIGEWEWEWEVDRGKYRVQSPNSVQ